MIDDLIHSKLVLNIQPVLHIHQLNKQLHVVGRD